MNGPRYLCALLLSCVFTAASARAAPPPSLEALWQIVQQQQTQIEELTQALNGARAQIASTEQRTRIAEEQLDLTAGYLEKVEQDRDSGWAGRTTLGGYGEMHYNNLDAEDGSQDLKEVDFHRFVAYIGHEFTDRIRFFSEVEIEHSLVQDTADGTNTGEVEIEQAYLEFDLNESLSAKGGLFLLPIGILNETHEPNTFYGVERNEVESIIIPSTWWEGGAAFSGRFSNGLSWDFAVHSGLETPTSGGSAYRVRSGRQKVSNANADNLALTARLKYTGVSGLELAASVNYQDDASQTDGDGLDDGTLVSVHGIWSRGPFNLRALWSQWNFNGDLIELAGADQQTGWYVEPSLRLGRSTHDWGVYARYQDLEGARTQDQFDQWEVGANYWPSGNVVLKFDYRNRSHDLLGARNRDFQGIDLGVGYQF